MHRTNSLPQRLRHAALALLAVSSLPFSPANMALAANGQPLQGNASVNSESLRLTRSKPKLQSAAEEEGTPDKAPMELGAQDNNGILQEQRPSTAIDLNAFKSSPLVGNTSNTSLPAKGNSTSRVQLLSDYDIELIVDSSSSMNEDDCPGGLSRWNWCGMQATDLARQISPFARRGLTITTFAAKYYVFENSSPSGIAELFSNKFFRIGTRLAEPLDNRLNSFFSRRGPGSKPLLIAVITDGLPHPKEEPQMVINTLIQATHQMKSPNEVTIVFFQIGADDLKGRAFLSYLDTSLVSQGARFDMVRTIPFNHLMQVGLAQSLVESIQEFAARNRPASRPAAAAAASKPRAKPKRAGH